MLRTNLSTRPFYNVRAVRVVLAVLALLVVMATLANVIIGLRLAATQRTLGARAADAESEAARLRGEAARIRSEIDPKELAVVSAAATEANAIIDRRAFSWTALFAQFEDTLPPDVRITAVAPRLERDGTFALSIAVEARGIEDLDDFVEALETQSTFHNVLPSRENTGEDGVIEALIEAAYVPRAIEDGPVPAADGGRGE